MQDLLLKVYKLLYRLYRRMDQTINYLGLEDKYEKLLQQGKRLFLCITIGRSGTRWLTDIISEHKNAVGSTERLGLIETFYRYVKWNKLQIDVQGIINLIKDSIVQDWINNDISMVNSPFFSHDLLYLYDVFKPEYIIWGVNDPKFTIISLYNKGWYKEENIRTDRNLINGIQPYFDLNHILGRTFGRLVPIEKQYQEWKKLTRIGKIAWFYNTVNMEIYNNIMKIPKEKVFIYKLEEADQNYEYYLRYAHKFGLNGILSKRRFLSIKKRTVKKRDNIQFRWSEKENYEFKKNVKEFYQIYKNLK